MQEQQEVEMIRSSTLRSKTVYLVSCVARKAATTMPAHELYQSDWFRKAKRYVLQRIQPGDRWFILSAEHHLVNPLQIIAPYNSTLLDMPYAKRQIWAQKVLTQLHPELNEGDRIVALAGERYREFLEPALVSIGYAVKVPMRGMGIGKQKAWLVSAVTAPE
jgi:hypothetical protein